VEGEFACEVPLAVGCQKPFAIVAALSGVESALAALLPADLACCSICLAGPVEPICRFGGLYERSVPERDTIPDGLV
jgi:hypothetical protein